MIRPRIVPIVFMTAAFAHFSCSGAATAQDTNAEDGKTAPADGGSLAEQIKELRKQVVELKSTLQKPRIIAAGTATLQLGAEQNNKTNVRIKLNDDIAAKIGDDYIVLLTNRFPTGGFPFFVPYWKQAKDGFDITIVDVNLPPNSTSSYLYNRNRTFLIDWIVVKK